MTEMSVFVQVWIVALMAVQSVIVALFVARMRAFRREDVSGERLPRAGVVLALRGSDPYLTDLLRALFRQDYPDFEVLIVLDDDGGAGRAVIESVVTEMGVTNVTIDALRDPLETCSLKCSAVRQAVSALESRCEVIALIDGDAAPHRLWLRDLVRPLRDPTIGVTTGNRWYMPRHANWGSLVRYFWNAGSVVQMWLNGVPWGGSMAMRVDVIRRIGLLSVWSRSLVDDSMVSREVHRHGYRVRFVPGVIAVNTERISLSQFLLWVRRQLVAARTPLRSWVVVLMHGEALALVQLLAAGLAIGGLMAGDGHMAVMNGLALAAFWIFNFATTAVLEHSMRRVTRLNGPSQRWLSPTVLYKLFPALLLTLVTYPYVLTRAVFCRRISWRGVEYEIIGRDRVRMIEYRPFGSPEAPGSAASLV